MLERVSFIAVVNEDEACSDLWETENVVAPESETVEGVVVVGTVSDVASPSDVRASWDVESGAVADNFPRVVLALENEKL